MARRWDGDVRGRGIADAGCLTAGAVELLAAFNEPDWVAEEPELHLLPQVRRWCDGDGRLVMANAASDGSGAYVLELRWQGGPRKIREVRAAVFALIGPLPRARRISGSAG